MACKIVVTEDAERDIDGIIRYIISEFKNPSAAIAFLDNVEECYRNIESNPRMYALCHDERLFAMGYRKAAAANYLVLYKVTKDNSTAVIARVIYGGRNYSEML